VAVTLLLVILAVQNAGCTLIGMGIGSAIPRYEYQPGPPIVGPEYEIAVEPGREIEVVRASDHQEFRGTFQGVTRGDLVAAVPVSVATPRDPFAPPKTERVAIKVTDIERLQVRERTGSHWATGAIVGAVLDTISIAVFAFTIKDGLPCPCGKL
jgi:hypothetical protein